MASLHDYLKQSELGDYRKVFPVLTVPDLGSNADSYLRAIAFCAIEQVKFLSTYGGVPLEVLYENVGQRQKAANITALSFVKKTGDVGTGLEMVDIPGDGLAGSYTNIFWQGQMGTTETGDTETLPISGMPIPSNLWTSQNNLITQQNAYLDDIKATFQEKREDLKVGFSIKEFTQSDTFKFLADMAIKKVTDWLTDAFPGLADDAILDTIAKYAPRAMGWGVVWLHKQFLAGAILCERMKEENVQLLALTASVEMYKLRSEIITQHDATVHSLLSQVALAETQLSKNGGSDLAQILDGALYATYDPTYGWKRNVGLTEQLNRALFYKDKEKLNEDIGIATILKDLVDSSKASADHTSLQKTLQDALFYKDSAVETEPVGVATILKDLAEASAEDSAAEPVIQCPHTGDFIFAHSRGKMTKA